VLPDAPRLHELVAVPEPPLHKVRRLSYSALALFERCSYRYYAERVAGMRPLDGAVGGAEDDEDGPSGLHATEIGDAAHRLLELVDLADPKPPATEVVRTWYPLVGEDELERIRSYVEAYCSSDLARRVASLPGARPEVPFAFEHDGVLLHGRLDVFAESAGRALVVDYKTNRLEELAPEEALEDDYALQRLVYALAAFRAGAEEVEVVYVFLERPDKPVARVFARAETGELEAELSAAIATIQEGRFLPRPSELACAGCPALDVVCSGPRLPAAAVA
jgi:ATP-dependent helicase/nuclease subunit A